MKVLKIVIPVCKVLGVYSKNSFIGRFIAITINVVSLAMFMTLYLPSVAFFIKYFSDMGKAMDAFNILAGTGLPTAQYLFFVFQKNSLRTMIEQLQRIINISKSLFISD